MIKIPLSSAGLDGTTFSLTTTGGCLLTALVFGHFGRIGKVNVMPSVTTLKVFRELGLVLFLTGAGISGASGSTIRTKYERTAAKSLPLFEDVSPATFS